MIIIKTEGPLTKEMVEYFKGKTAKNVKEGIEKDFPKGNFSIKEIKPK